MIDGKTKADKKYYLFRDKSYLFFNSFYDDSEIYWMSFLSGGHIDWEYYIQIKEDDFFSLWNEKTEIPDLYSKYGKINISPSESQEIEEKYKLDSVKNLHDLPSTVEKMEFKSVLNYEKT